MNSPHVVLWDLDLTLLDAGPVTEDILATAVARCSGCSRTRLPTSVAGSTDQAVVTAMLHTLGVRPVPGLLDEIYAEIGRETTRRVGVLRQQGRVMPGAAEVLARLAASLPELRQTLVTGSCRPSAEAKLAAFGLQSGLDLGLGAYGEESSTKEVLATIAAERGARAIGVPRSALSGWVVGDSRRDLAGARRAGLKCLLVSTGRERHDEHADADAVMSDLAAVESVVALLGGTQMLPGQVATLGGGIGTGQEVPARGGHG